MSKTMNFGLLAVFIAGVMAALGKAFIWGESVTNYGAGVPWGLWVGLYTLLVGIAGGAAWTGIYATWSRGGEPNRFTAVSFVVAGASLAFALAFIGTDLGKPLKGITIFLNPSFSSKLAWASWLYLGFFACLAGYFASNFKKVFMYLTGVFALGFLFAEGTFFGGMVARAMWNSWLTLATFITSAVVTGSAMIYLVGVLAQREVIEEEGFDLRKILLYSLIAHAVIEAGHIATGLGGGEKGAAIISMISSVPFLGLFVIAGVIAPLVMLWKQSDRLGIVPSALVLLGFAAYKYSFIRFGFNSEPLPGLADAFQHARLSLVYIPSAVEWVVAVGFLAGLIWSANLVIAKLLMQKRV